MHLSLLFASALLGSAPVAERPNILFLMADDHACAALGAYGSQLHPTPHLDRLAASGLLFERAFCSNSICAPSRAVILTGKHSHINGKLDNSGNFDASQWTFPKALQESGYHTALVGKWHLRTDPTGFDFWEVLPGQGQYYNPDFKTQAGTVRHEGYCTDVVTDRALRWLREDRDPERPFLLLCQHKAPHRSWMPGPEHLRLFEDMDLPEPATLFDDYRGRCDAARQQEMTIARHLYPAYDLKLPLAEETARQGPDRWAEQLLQRMNAGQRHSWDAAYGPENAEYLSADLTGKQLVRWNYQRYIKDYLRCVASVDDNIGRLLQYLEDTGLAENTLVVYTSDQGFFLGEHGWYDKRFMYEPSLQIPLILRWPRSIAPGQRVPALVQNLDFAPTFVELAGGIVPEEIQGRSLASFFDGKGPDSWRRSIYYQYYEVGEHAVVPHYGVRTDRHKLIHFPSLETAELYDLKTDPEEIDNRIDEPPFAALQAELEAELQRLRRHFRVPHGE
jgi:arylsulfatase A-like enzyme